MILQVSLHELPFRKARMDMVSHNNNSIHVIDDDRVVRHSLTQLLNKYGYDVKQFGSAEEYLDQIDEEFDGYILLDHKMQGMTGLELQEVLHTINVSPGIIFISAMGDQIRARALENGALEVFDKPFEFKELLKLIKVNN